MGFNRWEVLAGAYWYSVLHAGAPMAGRVATRLARLGYKPGNSVQHGRISQQAHATYVALAGQPDGYTACACRDCFETVIGGVFCPACLDADCELNSECSVQHVDCCPDCGGGDVCFRGCPSQL